MIGQTLANYKILDKLGEGGMGEVWRAQDTTLGREVAIKVLPEAFTADAERLARFEREARVLATFNHPRIAGIYGLEDVDGRKLLVMQMAEGETLAERIDRGPIPPEQALKIALQISEGLEAAHE
jgi:serine/threonine protein kinase